MASQIQRKHRILCLHGNSSSAKILNQQVHRWPETVLEKLDLVFLDAPFPVEENPDFSEFTNFEECLAYLEDYMINNGPFDGFLGFSQGAMLSAALPGMQRDGLALTKVPKIKFLILISGGKFGGIKIGLPELTLTAFSVPLELPSLHIIGDLDRFRLESIELMEAFVDPFVIYHPEGHTIPKLDEKSLEVVFAFIERIQETIRADEARICLNEKSKL
ncbi:Serine hydrolase FSH [Corchorus olitorius]|uniref:Serine hydrolase FSH n=1 Tax=Corchorus olitorius TaxID=93759 RepID=A0A1R3HRF8_9ROSI|nr:Serine hydrolase FSH [Corchorus olitorius]